VRLPEAMAPHANTLLAAPGEPPPYRQRLVHYVEDNETNVEVMRGVLAQRPQITMTSSTLGLDGLMAMRQQPPDLILLDMQLPDISGAELLRHLQQDQALADIAVIVVSADATPAHVEEALTLGAQHYVTKPLDVSHF
jgi:CheY-like chemotaxis protein